MTLNRGSVCFAVVDGVELAVKPFEREFYKPLGTAMVFTCELELSEEDDIKVEYTIKWFDVTRNREITDSTGRLVFLLLNILLGLPAAFWA